MNSTQSQSLNFASDELLVTLDAGVLTLTLNRPEKRNALGQTLCRRLFAELVRAKIDDSIKVVVLTGSEKVFSSGHDLSELALPSNVDSDPGLQFVRELAEFPKPLIAAVHGAAIGVGFALLLHCDFILVAQSALLTAPFVSLGMGSQFGMSYLLPRRIGDSAANEVLLFGKSIYGSEAADVGLANAALPDGLVLSKAMEMANELASFSLPALMEMKLLIKGATRSFVVEAIAQEAQAYARLLALPETRARLMFALQKKSSTTEPFGSHSSVSSSVK
jgi:enoyl-CoA hydratase/carnithine racemase